MESESQRVNSDRPFPENSVGGTGSNWMFPLNHGNVLGQGFPAKSRELPRSPGIPGEFPGNMQLSFTALPEGADRGSANPIGLWPIFKVTYTLTFCYFMADYGERYYLQKN